MNTPKIKLVKLLGRIPEHVPDWSKPVLRPFSGIYSKLLKGVYSSIKGDKLVKTPMGPYIYVNYSDWVERETANGTYERDYVDFFCSKIQEGDVVIDVGAYIGYFSLLASEGVGDKGCVYAFEPVPRNYERLMRNLKANQVKNVNAYNFGLSDKNETLPLSIPRDIPAESTLCESNWTEISKGVEIQKDVVKAKLTPFDRFVEHEGLKGVTIIKIDVEGAELKVLKGMRNVLKSNNLELFMEIVPPLIERMGGSIKELINILISCGFKTVYHIESGLKINIPDASNDDVEVYFGNISRNYIVEK